MSDLSRLAWHGEGVEALLAERYDLRADHPRTEGEVIEQLLAEQRKARQRDEETLLRERAR